MNSEKLGFALRPGVFSPTEIKEASPLLERSNKIASIFIPDGRSGYEAIEIASTILSLTSRVYAGSGVIRLLEHDPAILVRRVQTIQALSSNRLILGVGTGSPGPQPGKTVTTMLKRLNELKKDFRSFPSDVEAPQIYVATLKTGIAKRSMGIADGLLLNFCSPHYAAGLVESIRPQMVEQIEFACYLKIFYSSKNDGTARRLMVQEFLNYDSTPQYHEMFLRDGTADVISEFRKNDEWKRGPVELPMELLKVSVANPADDELSRYVRSFREAGVTLPVVYPYFPPDEESEFKKRTLRRILETRFD